jgi:uncharacterized membrane protein YfcA
MISLEFWFMFPIAIAIATIAMASGVEGATFFTPLFILALGLSPEIAIGTGLITEVFGFASGLYAYANKKLIDFNLGKQLLMITIPMAIIGTILTSYIPAYLLKLILGAGLLVLAWTFLRSPGQEGIKSEEEKIRSLYGGENAQTRLVTSDGEEIRYTVCNRMEGGIISGIGGLFIGMISTGQGELNGYFLLKRCKVPSRVAVATSVFVVALTALAASTGHFYKFVQSGEDTLNIVFSLIIFTVPGVIISGQLGPFVTSKISQHLLERGLAFLFIIVGLFTLAEVLF